MAMARARTGCQSPHPLQITRIREKHARACPKYKDRTHGVGGGGSGTDGRADARARHRRAEVTRARDDALAPSRSRRRARWISERRTRCTPVEARRRCCVVSAVSPCARIRPACASSACARRWTSRKGSVNRASCSTVRSASGICNLRNTGFGRIWRVKSCSALHQAHQGTAKGQVGRRGIRVDGTAQ